MVKKINLIGKKYGKIKGFILSTANNAAILSTSCGVLDTYSLKIKFDYEVGE